MRAYWVVPAVIALGCKTPAESSVAEVGATIDASTDSVAIDSAKVDAEAEHVADAEDGCVPPRFPARTDGCPCRPGEAPCSKDNLGQVCDYFGFCPTAPVRATCTFTRPSQGAPKYEWIQSYVPCPGDDTGVADAGDGG